MIIKLFNEDQKVKVVIPRVRSFIHHSYGSIRIIFEDYSEEVVSKSDYSFYVVEE